jgi:hypothetical protein
VVNTGIEVNDMVADATGTNFIKDTICSGSQACYTSVEVGGAVLGMVGPMGAAGGVKAVGKAADLEKAADTASEAKRVNQAATDLDKASDAGKAGEAGTDASKSKNLLTGKGCPVLRPFTAATMVLMGDGTREPISDVQVGDQVMSYDPGTDTQSIQTVTATWPHSDTVVTLTLADGSQVETTASHPWWDVTTRTYTRTDHLAAGDRLLTADGSTITVEGISGPEGEQQVWNLTITGPHTYYIGDTQILVHNCDAVDLDTLSQSGARPVKPGSNVSKAGQELEKHSGQGNFPEATGSVSNKNQMAQDQLDDILTDPGTVVQPKTSGNFPGGSYYIAPDGRGAAFDANGQFQYFEIFQV